MSTTPPPSPTPETDFDGAWKEALEHYLEDALALLFPAVHAAVDWSRPPAFRDVELQQIVRDADSGRTYVDKLVQVWLHDGVDVWILLHIEVQSQVQAAFPARMSAYYNRLTDRFEQEVVSLAILGDESPTWRPAEYAKGRLGCEMTFVFLIAKLYDFRARREELASSVNPFAVVVDAHLAAQDTRGDGRARRIVKVRLLRGLYERGYARQDILEIFRLIDWLLALPADQEESFQRDLVAIEEEHNVAYITSIERMGREAGLAAGREAGLAVGLAAGREEGLAAGREEGLAAGLASGRDALRRVVEARFGAVPASLEARIATIDSLDDLSALLVKAAVVPSPEEI